MAGCLGRRVCLCLRVYGSTKEVGASGGRRNPYVSVPNPHTPWCQWGGDGGGGGGAYGVWVAYIYVDNFSVRV